MLEWQTVFEYETINSDRGSKTVCWKVCAHLRVSAHEAGGQFDLKLISLPFNVARVFATVTFKNCVSACMYMGALKCDR